MLPSHRLYLRLEAAAAAALLGWLAWDAAPPWQLVVAVLIAPDLTFAAYLAGPRIGAIAYNLAHSSIGPSLLGLLGLTAWPLALPIALIWGLHIAIDRAIGYGLKSPTGFKDTHLGPL